MFGGSLKKFNNKYIHFETSFGTVNQKKTYLQQLREIIYLINSAGRRRRRKWKRNYDIEPQQLIPRQEDDFKTAFAISINDKLAVYNIILQYNIIAASCFTQDGSESH